MRTCWKMSMTYSGWIYVVFCTILLQGLVCEARINIRQCLSFEENVSKTLEAFVNNTAINEETNCIGNVKDTIEIVFIDTSGIPTYHCSYDFGTCTISLARDPSKCGCNNGTGSIFTYTLQFTATKPNNEGGEIVFRSICQRPFGVYLIKDSCPITFTTTTAPPATTDTTTPQSQDCYCEKNNCWLFFIIVVPVSLTPAPLPLPWPGYIIYILICLGIPTSKKKTGSPQSRWHPHYIFGRRTNDVYFSAWFVTNDGRTVLIWSKSPATGKFVFYGTEKAGGTNSSGTGHEMGAPTSCSVAPGRGDVENGNKHSSQKEKTKHTGTEGSPRKSIHPEAPVEITTVRTSSPPQAATIHGDNQASGTPHGNDQASATPRLRPLPEPSGMTSVERNSAMKTFNIVGRDKHPIIPPIGKSDNHP